VNFVIVMVLMLVVMYVLMIRPQRQRQAQQQSMIDGAGVGDDILTTGGIYGTITQADGDDIVVSLADGFDVHMTRRAIAAVLPPEEDEEGEAEEIVEGEALETTLDDADEAGVADGEEAVRSEESEGAGGEPRL
jgi:preprotein translocase subunit YajC